MSRHVALITRTGPRVHASAGGDHANAICGGWASLIPLQADFEDFDWWRQCLVCKRRLGLLAAEIDRLTATENQP